MRALYNSRGACVGYLGPRGRIVARSGRVKAVIVGSGAVHDPRGRHIGWWREGYLRGRDGGVMAFRRGARLRVTPPMVGPPPLGPQDVLLTPVSPIRDTPPLMPAGRFAWSSQEL